jgi:Tfp pilus assembly protein PilF
LSIRQPERATIGHTDKLAVPVPEGASDVARVSWRGGRGVVHTFDGQEHVLGPGERLDLSYGPVRLAFVQQRAATLRRIWPTELVRASVAGTYLLGLVLIGLTLAVGVAAPAHQTYCSTWLARDFPSFSYEFWICPQHQMSMGADRGSRITADYLERILRGDFEGSPDDGAYSLKVHKVSDRPSIFMPAGDKGPHTDMGGAERVDIKPRREHSSVVEAKPAPEEQPLLAIDNGTPIQIPQRDPVEATDGADMADELDAVADAEPAPPVAEEKSGWGIRDWYDEEDEAYDNATAETMKRLAKRVLQIDPNDADALSVLSYYQYLSEEYDAAIETYDKFIALYPEEAAGYNNKALIFKRRAEYQEEERLYRVALSYDPDDSTALNNLAVNLSHQGRHEEAMQIMKDLEVADPGDPYADLHRAKIYADMDDEEQALHYLEQALKGMTQLDTLHHIEFRQDIRVDPSFNALRKTPRFKRIMWKYYGDDAPVPTE